MRLYKRNVSVGIAGLLVSRPRIEFDLRRTSESTPDSGTIKLWNISPATEAVVDEQGTDVVVRAGYDGRSDTIATGVVRRVTGEWDGLDRRLKVAIGDASVSPTIKGGVTTKSYAGESTWIGTIVQDAVTDMGMSFGDLAAIPQDFLVNFSWSGKSADLIDVLLLPRGVEWYVDGMTVMFTRVNQPDPGPTLVVSPDTGMIESPTFTEQGVRVKMLLNPTVVLAQQVEVRSDVVRNDFKCVGINHKGSNRDGPFYTEMELWDLARLGE